MLQDPAITSLLDTAFIAGRFRELHNAEMADLELVHCACHTRQPRAE